jgi:hypothetical protein
VLIRRSQVRILAEAECVFPGAIAAGVLVVANATTQRVARLWHTPAQYGAALEKGRAAAEIIPGVLDAVMSIVAPIVHCNRAQIDNGRTYLREMVFGDHEEPHHGEALAIAAQTEESIAAVLRRDDRFGNGDAATLARVVSSVMFLSMAANVNVALSVEEIVQDIRRQVRALLARSL